MNEKAAPITPSGGQDSAGLAELLLRRGYAKAHPANSRSARELVDEGLSSARAGAVRRP
jgi:hypothetical protein